MFYSLIFISTIFLTSSLNSMEIVKKNRKPNTTLKKYLLTKEIGKNNDTPIEISNYITQHHITLLNNHLLDLLKDENSTMVAWDDAHIPVNYYLLLNYPQIELIKDVLLSSSKIDLPYVPQYYERHRGNPYQWDYFIQSEDDYKLFLTLPIELRKCLAQAPKVLINWWTRHQQDPLSCYKNIPIPTTVNPSQAIQVKSEFTIIKQWIQLQINMPLNATFLGYTPQPIVPEEKQLSLQ